jgi:glycosyltransferase involved in cell wall biosynthesis
MKEGEQNWLYIHEIKNLLYLADFNVAKTGGTLLLPLKIPLISTFFNKYIAKLPLIKRFCLVGYVIADNNARETKKENKYKTTVLVPARNEEGNIEDILKRIPQMGNGTEIIFVEGNSTDNTYQKIEELVKQNPLKDIKLFKQPGKGKGDAVRKGFENATGDILMILDADMTVPPEDLPKFYNALSSGKGEFINGSRLVYQMHEKAMRSLNKAGNIFFSNVFSWLLDQRITDTLCGTKVLFKKDYLKIVENRKYFGDFDPFGDFDLLFGAAKLKLKIIEIPVRYGERTYGETNISRFRDGMMLLRMCFFAMRKIKFNK